MARLNKALASADRAQKHVEQPLCAWEEVARRSERAIAIGVQALRHATRAALP